jgi:hypothetical protein
MCRQIGVRHTQRALTRSDDRKRRADHHADGLPFSNEKSADVGQATFNDTSFDGEVALRTTSEADIGNPSTP